MRRIRSRRFHITLRAVIGASVLFLIWLAVFGRRLAASHFSGVTDCVFAVFGLAAFSFLLFCFFPYFRGDRRWFGISGVLTAVFFVSASMLWTFPLPV